MKLDNMHLNFLSGKNKNMFRKYKYESKKELNNNYDKLFFNFLCIVNPDKLNYEYNRIHEKNIKYEMSHEMIDFKYKKIENVINNLCYEDDINLHTLSALASFNNINLIYNNNNIYSVLCDCNNSSRPYFLVNMNKDIYQICKEKLEKIKSNCYNVENILKPMYSMTHYKLDDLKEMIDKMKIELEVEKKYKKQELYDKIKQQLNNDL
uniref:Rho termination factor N-terminal domain-containing protein n=1 Tax=Florenciella sp. virus SA2 TaxID=3240092 RepID=A0AB39JBQ2_9VIRU